jgi:hypothetical protein
MLFNSTLILYFYLFVLVAFFTVNQISEKNNLKEERFILAHSFRGFSSWPLPLLLLDLLQGRIIKVERHGRRKLLIHGIHKAERRHQEAARDKI